MTDVEKIKISKGNPTRTSKKHVDPKPSLNEARDQSRVDGLITAGLGENVDVSKYRQVIMNPKSAVNSLQCRDAVGRVLDSILEVVFSDPSLYQRVRQDLQHKHIHEEEVDEGFVGDVMRNAAQDIADKILQKHLGVVGKAISRRTVKKSKKKS